MSAERRMNDVTEAELRAVFGPRADYYLWQWKAVAPLVNWPAALLGVPWFLFRRLHALALVLCAVWGCVELGLGIILGGHTDRQNRSVEMMFISQATWFVSAVVCGVFSNRWYLARVRRVISSTRARGLPSDDHLAELARQGGTRLLHAIGFVVLLGLVMWLIWRVGLA
jgi:hypothetical protein